MNLMNQSRRKGFLYHWLTSQSNNSAINPFSIENSSKGVTKNEILSNSLITIVAGYDNVASSVQVILYRLATNPKVQARLFQDISALDEIRDNWTLLYLQDTIFITLGMTGIVSMSVEPWKVMNQWRNWNIWMQSSRNLCDWILLRQ